MMESSVSNVPVTIKTEPKDADGEPAVDEDCRGNSTSNSSNSSVSSGHRSNNSSNNNNNTTEISVDFKSQGQEDSGTPAPPALAPLRYVSRRGRPPGGGYSMKSNTHYVSFSTPVLASQDFSRQASSLTASASTPSLSSQDILKPGLLPDAVDMRRFGFQGFETEKNAFRCEGCDVVFATRDTYAMHMLLRAKNESCVALPSSAISSNPENPTPREKFEKELRQQAMITALRSQAVAMSKAAVVMLPKSPTVPENLSSHSRSPGLRQDDTGLVGAMDAAASFNSLLSLDNYGLYMDSHQYRRFMAEYGLRASASSDSFTSAVMEQLGCSVCGELFNNKDALAMHMMFHTREEEAEKKPDVSWVMDQVALSQRLASNRSRQSVPETRAKKHETSTGERQLTAERVAELKRMAIESSLKSAVSCKSTGASATSTINAMSSRPKSVSEDMIVTSSAQTRPLSADDAIKLSRPSFKDMCKPRKAFILYKKDINGSKSESENTDLAKIARKRTMSTTEEAFRSFQNSDGVSGAKSSRHQSDVYMFSRDDSSLVKSPFSVEADRVAKVCDNHVSSATGPRDSDETSEGSASSNNETDIAMKQHTSTHAPPSPSLDVIMSQDAVLVPLESLEEDPEKDKLMSRFDPRGIRRSLEASALDFSLDNRRDHQTNSSPSVKFPGVSRHEDRPARHLSSSVGLSNSHGALDSHQRGSYPPFLADQELEPKRSTLSDGTSSSGCDVTGNHVDEERSSAGALADASRVGEARYCPHCEILFLDVTLFHLHMGLHNVNNPWQCNTCGIVCAGRLEFNIHVLHY